MKQKLFFIATLILSSFAFVSCDEVIDNPAISSEASLQQWNYELSVKFADFDFTGVPGGPYAYKAPQKLYVYNEAGTELGELTTADEIDDLTKFYKFAGTLEGTFGENLIISTIKAADYAKQDGTLKSIIDNNVILQATKVAVRNYSTAASVVYTANATLENKVAIAYLDIDELKGGDKVTITADDKSFEYTINSEFDPTVSTDLFVAVPVSEAAEPEYKLSANAYTGYMLGAPIKSATFDLVAGKVNKDTGNNPYDIVFETQGVDLTAYDAYMRKNDVVYPGSGGYGYMYRINNNMYNTFSYSIPDDKSFIITQSGEAIDSLDIAISGTLDKDVALTIDNVRLGEDHYFEIYNGAKFSLTLVGANEFGMLNLNTPYTKKGEGTWEFDRLNIGGKVTTTTDTDLEIDKNTVDYFAEYTFNEDITLKELNVYQGAVVNNADGKKVKITDESGWLLSIAQEGTLNVGEGSTLDVYSASQKNTIVSINGGKLNIKKGATVSITGYKDNTALSINSSNTWANQNPNSSVKIGEGASLTLKGGIENSLGQGLYISSMLGGYIAIELEKDATLIAEGIDKDGAISCNANDWRSTTSENARPTTITFNIAEGAEVVANETAEASGFNYYGSPATTSTPASVLSITGKGTFEAKSAKGGGMVLDGKVNITGANVAATGGKSKPAIKTFATTALTLTYSKDSATKLTAKAGTGSTICIADADDNELAKFAEASFTDTTADGVRTITPKAPAE